MPFIRSRAVLFFSVIYLVFAFVMAMAGRHPDIAAIFPSWLIDTFNPNDKTNLAPYRFLHFMVIAFLVIRFLPRDWPGLEWRAFRPAILCGQQSLEVFCVGTFLSFAGHFVLVEDVGTMSKGGADSSVWSASPCKTCTAWYRSWTKKVDRAPRQAAPRIQLNARSDSRQGASPDVTPLHSVCNILSADWPTGLANRRATTKGADLSQRASDYYEWSLMQWALAAAP